MRLNNLKIVNCLPFLIIVFVFVACGQKSQKTSGETVIESEQEQVAIEFVLENETFKNSLIDILKGTPMELYVWKNHVVLFGNAADTLGIGELIRETDFSVNVKKYIAPMYVFNRADRCNDTTIPKPWKNYLLTANLVEDTVLQQEYMNYHKTQFEEWPEVAEGFCRAEFQQLLVFLNGRQLMLIISIPADKTLDELNPKTVENNPRAVEWNNIMGKYQEGIAGTDPDETWVFLDKVESD